MVFLSRLLDEKFLKIKGYNYHYRGEQVVNHFVFMDGIIIFYNGTKKEINMVWKVLKEFMEMSGMGLNIKKCAFYTGKNMCTKKVDEIKEKTGFFKGELSMNYLGVNIFKGKNNAYLYGDLILKIQGRLSNWKNSFLSVRG